MTGIGCGDDEAAPGAALSVYVSVPLRGDGGAGRQVVRGVTQALLDAGGRAGDYKIVPHYLYNTGDGEEPDPVIAAANARRATEDSRTIAYIGDMDHGVTATSLPITNQAEILHIDPGLAGSFLSRPIPGQPDPERFRPGGARTYLPLYPTNNDVEFCGSYGDLGYEAMSLILDAVEDDGADRDAITEEVLTTRNRQSRIGTYRLNGNDEVILEGEADCF